MKKVYRMALINAGIAAGLVFAGAFVSGHISWQGVIAAAAASVVTLLTNLKRDFSKLESKKRTNTNLFAFV